MSCWTHISREGRDSYIIECEECGYIGEEETFDDAVETANFHVYD